ncbi:MAG: glycosyltransferase family 87 protein [Flavobacteriales bacterium]|jgi:hypothetical protein
MRSKLLSLANNTKFQWGFMLLFAGLITAQRLLVANEGFSHTLYNNYLIFQQSFFHLLENEDLYKAYPQEHYDLFKYSPSFALFMGVIAYFPVWIGLFLWNSLNVFVLFLGLKKLKFTRNNGFVFASLFVLIELITTTQNSQSNALIAGLILLAFDSLENSKVSRSAWMLIATVFIKLFGLVAFVLYLFYPKKIKSGLLVIFWVVVLSAIPLLFIDTQSLYYQYISWLNLLGNDHSNELKFSVMGFLNSWFGVSAEFKNYILLLGVFMFGIPLIKIKSYKVLRYKQLYTASVLLWVVLFNHMAESATFILAVTGVAVWYFTKNEVTLLDKFLMILTVLFTLLSPSDIYPEFIRKMYFIPYTVKVIPCILVWLKINFELLIVNEKIKKSS